MISDLGIWTIIINLIAIAFAVQYSRSKSFGEALLWLVWDFTGLRFIVSKVFPVEKSSTKRPVTIALWVIGIYTALFGIASNRYENSVDKIENRMNAFITQLAVTPENVRRNAFREIYEIQSLECPVKPELLQPSTIISSLVRNSRHKDAVTVLTRVVEKYRGNLEGAQLWLADFYGADLENAKFKGATLVGINLTGAALTNADFQNALLQEAHLEGAFLKGANFTGAQLAKANMRNSLLWGANFEGASLDNVDMEGAELLDTNLINSVGLVVEQLCSTRTLYLSKMDPNLKNQVQDSCPEKLDPLK